MKLGLLILLILILGPAMQVTAAQAWVLVLPDSVVVQGPTVRLGQIVTRPIPTGANDMIVQNSRRPGTLETISRRTVLRQLVSNGLATGVRIQGAQTCRIFVSGQEIPATDLAVEIHSVLKALMPPVRTGAPASWLEVQVPETPIFLAEHPLVRVSGHPVLKPGRNQVSSSVYQQNGIGAKSGNKETARRRA